MPFVETWKCTTKPSSKACFVSFCNGPAFPKSPTDSTKRSVTSISTELSREIKSWIKWPRLQFLSPSEISNHAALTYKLIHGLTCPFRCSSISDPWFFWPRVVLQIDTKWTLIRLLIRRTPHAFLENSEVLVPTNLVLKKGVGGQRLINKAEGIQQTLRGVEKVRTNSYWSIEGDFNIKQADPCRTRTQLAKW